MVILINQIKNYLFDGGNCLTVNFYTLIFGKCSRCFKNDGNYFGPQDFPFMIRSRKCSL